MKHFLIATALLGLSVPAAAQEQPEKRVADILALKALDREAGLVLPAIKLMEDDPVRGIAELRKLAVAENAFAQLILAAILSDGEFGVAKDPVESFKWYLRVAQGPAAKTRIGALAASAVGQFYASGRGVARNDAEGLKWLRISAEGGDPGGMGLYGVKLAGNKNYAEAVRWLEPAAATGDRNALAMLGALYRYGTGVPKDNAKALALFEQSAEKGSGVGALSAASLYAEQTPPADDKILHFTILAAQADNPDGMGMLGAFYRTGLGVPKNLDTAEMWLRRAAEQDQAEAMFDLFLVLVERQGDAALQGEGRNWLEKAAAAEQKDALFLLGMAYERGQAPYSRDQEKALGLYRRAADKGSKHAKEALARLGIKQ